MKGFDKLHVKSAVKSHNKFDLSHSHLTTMDFGEIMPLLALETVPGDKFNINASYFSRMAPLVKPTYGKFQFKTMAAFVPFYQIADDAEAYLAGKNVWEGDTPDLRYTNPIEIFRIYYNNATTVSVPSGGSATKGIIYDSNGNRTDTYDFTFINSSGNRVYYKLSEQGRLYVKILNALGYTFPQGVDMQTSSQWFTEYSNFRLSVMPLLAFAKAYNDWMTLSTRYNTSPLTSLLKKIKHNVSVSGKYTASTHMLLASGISDILNYLRLCYDNDYFTSAWQYPNDPIGQLENAQYGKIPGNQISDLDSVISDVYNNRFVTDPRSDVSGNPYTSITQRALDFLKSFDDWVRRNNYSGSRAVQNVYSRFGIKTEDYRSNYAHVICTDSLPIQVGDVTSQAGTTDATLGDYAGKGIMNGDKGFSFDCSDYGMLFILGWYTVSPMNAFGFDKSVLRVDPFDFYNPEFDGLGAEAISYGELYASPCPASSDSTSDKSVFGFTERYNSYRYGRDKITGEFRDYKDQVGMNIWHTGRYLTDIRASGGMVAQSTAMNTLSPLSSEYNRIFSNISGDVDHFYMTARFNISAVRPMLSLNQVPRLGEGDTVVEKNGNVIN